VIPRVVIVLAVAGLLDAAAEAPHAGPRKSVRAPGLILYWTDSPRPSIWSVRPDGTHRHLILRTRQNAKRPRLAPDRTWVAFDGTPAPKPPLSDFDIQLVRLNGTGLRTITRGSDWDIDAQWSPDGSSLSFSRATPHPNDPHDFVVWVMRRNGRDVHPLVEGSSARWSPDGTELVFSAPTDTSDGDLFVINVDGTDRRRLTTTPATEFPAAWSRDGSRILFTRSQRSNTGDVFVMNADGTNVRKLGRGFAAAWSPDGSKILYTPLFGAPLWVMNADGSHKRRIASVRAFEPSWR
jgi:Tol biopolymer transport system component